MRIWVKAGPWVVLLELVVFVLDTLTLWAIFQALGAPISPIHALVTYMLASAVAMISVIPGGPGSFEAAALAVLHVFGAPFAARRCCCFVTCRHLLAPDASQILSFLLRTDHA